MVLIAMLAGGLLYAESPHFIESPQKTASAGQFLSDTDYFMDPHSYTNLKFDKWFGALSFYSDLADFQTSMAQLGFASQFGDVYMGLYYAGNAWNIQPHEYMEISEVAGFFPGKTIRSYTSLPSYVGGASNRPRNEAAVLIGYADIGIRLSFISTHWSRKLNQDFKAATVYYKSFNTERGSLNPEIALGIARELIPDRGIKPHMYIDVDFYRDYEKYERYTSASATAGEYISNSDNHITLGFTAALGGFSIVKRNTFDFGADLWYTLGLIMYNNEYNYTEGGVYKVGKNLKGRYRVTNTGADISEESGNGHLVTPYLYATWAGAKLELAAELGLGLGFGFVKTAEMALQTGAANLVRDGQYTDKTLFAFSPVLSVGMKWEIVATKFFLNAGGSIGLGVLEFTTTESVEYNQGTETAGSAVKSHENIYQPASTELSIGVTLNPTANLGLQALCGVDVGNIVNVFSSGSGGFVVFSSILATVKF